MINRYAIDELKKDLKYLQMYIGELLTGFELNEAICDFYESDRISFNNYGTCLGFISSSLKYKIQMLGYLLFSKKTDQMNIHKVLNKINSDLKYENKEVEKRIKQISLNLEKAIEEKNDDYDILTTYRDNVYAHWEKKIFNEDFQKEFLDKNKLNFLVFIDLAKVCFDSFTDILKLLNEEPYICSLPQKHIIERFINKLQV